MLQQRIVMHSTRIDMQTGLLREQSASVFAEAEMQEVWIETQLGGSGVLDVGDVERAGEEFQTWLDEDGKSRRNELQNEANHARLRRAVREKANARQSTTGT